jgi:hypothetical protein
VIETRLMSDGVLELDPPGLRLQVSSLFADPDDP